MIEYGQKLAFSILINMQAFGHILSSSTLKYVINQNPITGNNVIISNVLFSTMLTSLNLNRSKLRKQTQKYELDMDTHWCCRSSGVHLFVDFMEHKAEKTRRRQDVYFLELTASESFKDVHQLEGNGGSGNDLLLFSFFSIMAATDDFSVENKLGQGGFGPVYKGKLSNGQEIAVKRLSRTLGQGLVEFKNELVLISKLQHINLVQVLGCCIHREEKMLIYEYMPNKSLDFFLFDSCYSLSDENRKGELDWPKRFNIIEGIAQGLLYMHRYSRIRIIHRDLKANNILLDENMNPKISDFGMARIFKRMESEAITNRVVGTYGYMPPEYAIEGTFSIKSDIFSFGVLILEIVMGRRNSSFVHLDQTFNLIEYAWELWRQGDALGLMDPVIGSTCVVQQFIRTIHVALLCVQQSATDRPTTTDMISMLLNETILLPTICTPAFVIRREETRPTSEESRTKDCSENLHDLSVGMIANVKGFITTPPMELVVSYGHEAIAFMMMIYMINYQNPSAGNNVIISNVIGVAIGVVIPHWCCHSSSVPLLVAFMVPKAEKTRYRTQSDMKSSI
ncbi:hypothetical protein OSB04_030587 [Centaurea solstitialis]|uniref:non-specific serine/threonine protein kinase n=1 Tax=Centaurea solstitialis TaxID=347529 RepID=A0AA38S795_9ASTR|nr:hypothetical protein OSB04_030587 [Centaurea solstitialis]